MAFTKSNEILTRISLKYDEYSNWTSKNPVLLKGEVAIATIEAGSTTTPAMQNLPNVVMKVGDGTSKYNALPFVSALAADVYSWAKAATKPSYAVSEISGALEYRLVTVDATNHKYALQARKAGSAAEWSNVADSAIDLSGLVSRVTTIESDLNTAKTGLKARVTQAETDIDNLQKAIGSGGSVSQAITAAVQALDSSASQTAGNDGLALSVTLVDGLVTDISGSIAANTYDAHGSAAAVQGKTTHTVADAYALADAAQTADEVAAAVKVEENARKAAIEALDYTGVEGTQSGTTVKFVDKISQANGIVSAELGELVFNSAYNASTNKAATMSDITRAVADLNGAMHFEGVYPDIPSKNHDGEDFKAGDVIIVGTTEYVFVESEDENKFIELGDEGAIAAAINALDANVSQTAAANNGQLALNIVQDNGVIKSISGSIKANTYDAYGAAAGVKTTLENGIIKTHTGKLKTIQGNDTTKSMRTVAAEEATKAVQALDKTNAAQSGKYISAITQTDGLVTATYADLPAIPEIPDVKVTHNNGSSTPEAPTENEVVVVKDISASGHTITDTHVKVATMAGVTSAINALDNSDAAVDGEFVTVAKQTNGVVNVSRAKVNIKHLAQDTNTYVVFNCGSASKVI